MHISVEKFVARVLPPEDIKGKFVIEAGALDVNGSVRKMIESAGPSSYIATDMREDISVDVVCMAEYLPSLFGYDFADIVICLEMLEHAEHWKSALAGILRVLRTSGSLVLTTRSPGFPIHAYPEDYWRFSVSAMAEIMGSAGLLPEAIEHDLSQPGVFVKAVKPAGWVWDGVPSEWDTAEVQIPPGEIGPEWRNTNESLDQMIKIMTGEVKV